MLIPKPVAARVAALRERRATLGLVRVEVWVRPEHAELVRRYAAQVAIAADIGPEPAMVRAIRNVTQHYRNLNAEFADPTPDEIRAAREAAGLTQTAAAELVHSTMRAWQWWESGDRAMHPAMWELFRLKVRPE